MMRARCHPGAIGSALAACLLGAAGSAQALPQITVNDVQVTEGADAAAVFTVSLDAAPGAGQTVALRVAARNGTAKRYTDYAAFATSLRFSPTSTLSRQVSVPLVDDAIAEPTEQFVVLVTSVTNATLADDRGAATVLDDDANHDPVCSIDTPAGDVTTYAGERVEFAGSVSDTDGDVPTIAWAFPGGSPASAASDDPGAITYATPGTYPATLDADDGKGGHCVTQGRTVTVHEPPTVSINSHSVTGLQPWDYSPVPERKQVLGGRYSVLAVNDLGMHCVDLDGRIANILPPFNVLLGQVIEKGATPVLNPPAISLAYSAASNPADPSLAGGAGYRGLAPDGSVYKTNFWELIDREAWDAFYPPIATPLATGPFPVVDNTGLPVPNTELLYIGPDGIVDGTAGSHDGSLAASQHTMPGIATPLVANEPQPVLEYYRNKPFFVNLPIGYVADNVNWHEAAGIPIAPFDDAGRENPFPLVRVEATSASGVVATSDAVLPVSAETSCSNCHAATTDIPQRRSTLPTDALADAGLPVADSSWDPERGHVPAAVSIEYGADINILRLHDLKHGAAYVDPDGSGAACDLAANPPDGDTNCLVHRALVENAPVVCQSCHYTPALDLAQVGPMAGPPGSDANGRNQLAHESNSRVMHNHHGGFTALFPPIPAPIQDALTGAITNQGARTAALENNCYQCHPGKETHCLRGAMFNGGVLCSDCHGTMKQVGADFSAGVSPSNPGAFQLGLGNFFDRRSPQPRVPWANEPGCGSCHTGHANRNLAGRPGTVVNLKDSHGVTDGIRLRQAFRTGDVKATPIVPSNKTFAEPVVPASFNGFANPNAGNPKLYRVSTGHGGVMCEGCHGATHAEWPVADPAANDNLISNQLQGHAGAISECSTCHGATGVPASTLKGPHGMHVVDDSRFWREAHEDLAHRANGQAGGGACGNCHGADHLGTVLSRAPVRRTFMVENRLRVVEAGQPVACNLCHSIEQSWER